MAGPWLVDKSRFASKIKSASGTSNPGNVNWTSNPSRSCPNCQHVIDNDDVTQDWPGLPRGVKFDPSDQEIIWHLLAKLGLQNFQPHPFIDEFIPTVNEDDGICYTHPGKLPGVSQDGTASHFFHRAIKAYSTGTRKRRKIHGDDLGDVRWHKTGRTKAVIMDGVQRGCKKIMVLYVSPAKGGKAEKTNWVMHQYHLGTQEDEKEGQYVISKVFYQQQQNQLKQGDNILEENAELIDDVVVKVDPVTPKSVIPDPPRTERRSSFGTGKQSSLSSTDLAPMGLEDCEMNISDHQEGQSEKDMNNDKDEQEPETDEAGEQATKTVSGEEGICWDYNCSQNILDLDSQQLEALSLGDLLNSQPSNKDVAYCTQTKEAKPGASSSQFAMEDLNKEFEYSQALAFDPGNLYLDTPPDFRLSQLLEFESQDSLSWAGAKISE